MSDRVACVDNGAGLPALRGDMSGLKFFLYNSHKKPRMGWIEKTVFISYRSK
jgi:hypothetical protein